MRIIVTGGAGFIGSALVRYLIQDTPHETLVIDKLTYAGTLASLHRVQGHPRFHFSQTDIAAADRINKLFATFDPDAVIHLAAESHIDRSIAAPDEFVTTNVIGTYVLLEAALAHWRKLRGARAEAFRFLHVSTDEVYGSLPDGVLFTEMTPYNPHSPYSATKAASDHLVRAWGHTYGLPIIVTNCSNNYGPYQFPEKLIALAITRALRNEPIPLYGEGLNVRDWLFVDDHVKALVRVLKQGRLGETYNIGGDSQRRNVDVVLAICDALDRVEPRSQGGSYRELMRYVADRPGHDFRYAIDFSKIRDELDWMPTVPFEAGLAATIDWYIQNRAWWEPLLDSAKTPGGGLQLPGRVA
ncbi:MAG: dTDP-glucose 4,6-dehydratase [Xanthobacteraceae bacterium]